MKFISQDIKLVKEAIINAVMNDKSVMNHKDNLEILQAIESLQKTIIKKAIREFYKKSPTRDELNKYVNELVDDASSDVVEPYRKEIIHKAECNISFSIPSGTYFTNS